MTDTTNDLYFDPYDIEIDARPYPVYKRLRDEAPLYYNGKFDFFALSRFSDVEAVSKNWQTYSSAKGTVLELIKGGFATPPGMFIFEDPPLHDLHRGIIGRVFTPKRVADLEPKVRNYCAQSLDPLVGSNGFDFVKDLGGHMPMRTIGMLLGIPESDQAAIRDSFDETFVEGEHGAAAIDAEETASLGDRFGEYIDWRADHPSDDLMTDLINAEFVDELGVTRRLTRSEILCFVGLLAAGANETTTRLIGWMGKVLAEHPDQRRELAADRSLIPGAIEELLRFESPSPTQARYVTADVEHYGTTVPAGSTVLFLTASANRDEREFDDPDRFDIHRKIKRHLAFGVGAHFCIGSALARLEGRVALDEVLNRWTEWDVDWSRAKQSHSSTVRGWEHMPVVVP
ncbi:MAG TPA: cytochrome P450 [Ilumatobacteraceae bacterium]